MPGISMRNRASYANTSTAVQNYDFGADRLTTILNMADDAIPALQALDHENHILFLTPTTPQTHQYDYLSFVAPTVSTYHKSVLCMDYTPPPNSNKYLPFDNRHADALANPNCAGVIVVIRGDEKEGGAGRRGTSMDFARKVWEEIGGGAEMPGLLIEVGGSKRGVGDWRTILWTEDMDGLEDLAHMVFGAR